jgi:PKD repeat protein
VSKAASSSWLESGTGAITWNNQPGLSGAVLSSAGAAALNSWVEFDLGSSIVGNGSYSFVLSGGNSDVVYYTSREASANKPQLLLTQASGPVAPVAAFSATPTSGAAPLAVQFTDNSTGSPSSWAWDFDDNGTVDSTEQNPSVSYTAAGSYAVKLTVTNAQGTNSLSKSGLISVSSGSGGGGGTGSATLLATGDVARDTTLSDQSGATSNLYAALDELPSAADDGTSYVRNVNKSSGSYVAQLSDLPSNFATMSGLRIGIRGRTVGWVDDTTVLYAQVVGADGVTALTTEVVVATNPGTSAWATVGEVAFSGVVAGDKARWDGARLRLRWGYSAVGTADTTQLRLSAVALSADFSTTP